MEKLFISLKSLDNNINGIGLGNKIKNDITTRENAIIVYVNKKLPLSAISPDKKIPEKIKFDDQIYSSDVVQSTARSAAIFYEYNTSCHGNDAMDLGLPDPTSSIYLNRSRLDILSGGCNFTTWTPDGISAFSTLGGIFKDKLDGSYVGITNRHNIDKFIKTNLSYLNRFTLTEESSGFTYYKIPFLNFYSIESYAKEFEFNDPNNPDVIITTTNFKNNVYNYSIANHYCFQPSKYIDSNGVPHVDSLSGNNCIGYVKRAIPALIYDRSKLINFNYADGAVISLTNRVNSTSKNQIGFYWLFENPALIATDEEIDFIVDNKRPLFYSGSRSGPIGKEAGATLCTLRPIVNYRIVEIGSAVFTTQDIIKDGYSYLYSDCIEYESVIYDWVGEEPPDWVGNKCKDANIPPPGWFPCNVREGIIPGDVPTITFKPALLPGDSGSLVWGLLSATPTSPSGWKIVGLNFATTHDPSPNSRKSTGIFCRITNVMKELELDVWNGEQLNFSNNTTHEVTLKNIDFTKLNERLEDELINYIEVEGKRYYYAGSKYTRNFNDITYKI